MMALRKIVDEKAKIETNKDLVNADDPDIIELEAKEKVRSCWHCGSLNYLIKQQICINQGIKKQFIGRCNGKRLH